MSALKQQVADLDGKLQSPPPATLSPLLADARLVALTTHADGSPGLGSGWLCRHMAAGDTTGLRIRSNPGFHPPADDVPMILIGNGTGIAGPPRVAARRAARARRPSGPAAASAPPAGSAAGALSTGPSASDRDNFDPLPQLPARL